MTNTLYSISAANRITGKSRTTIAKHIRSGHLSFTTGADGAKLIDASELMRVYGDACRFEREEGRRDDSSVSLPDQPPLSTQLDKEIAERQRERQHYEKQLEQLQEALRLAQEGHNRATLLLQHQQSSGGGQWQGQLAALEARIANQEQRAREDRERLKATAKRKIAAYRQALEAERAKTFWLRLFG